MVENNAKTMLKFVIEHLEQEISPWLLIEYEHASKIVGKNRLIFTNIKKKADAVKLSRIGVVKQESCAQIFRPEEMVILDPKATEQLKFEDFLDKKAVVIGGILGDHPPRGRTSKLITNLLPQTSTRNLGKLQFTIDGAVYMAKLISEGTPLEEIPIKKGLTIKVNKSHAIHLPYAYPIKNSKPLISQKLIKYLLSA